MRTNTHVEIGKDGSLHVSRDIHFAAHSRGAIITQRGHRTRRSGPCSERRDSGFYQARQCAHQARIGELDIYARHGKNSRARANLSQYASIYNRFDPIGDVRLCRL